MYVVAVEFVIKETFIQQFMEAMLKQAENSLELESECKQFDVCVDPENEFRIFLYEIYTTKSDFDTHLASEHFISFNDLVTPWIEDKNVQTWNRVENQG